MFSLPGLIAIVVAQYTKFNEIVPTLRALPIMHVLYLLSSVGLLLDLRLRLVRPEACPHWPLVLPLWVWTLLSAAVNGGQTAQQLSITFVYMMLFLLVAHGVQSFRALRLLAMSVLATSLFLGVVTFMQARSPFQCNLLTIDLPSEMSGRSDGRSCATAADCNADAEPGERYLCERPGLLGTMSISHGRVRYRGILEDPNELALVLVISLPLAMALLAQSLSVIRVVFVAATFAIVIPVVIWTSSRTGQIAFVVVIAAYLLRKIRLKTVLAVLVLAAPALLLGGRSGAEAEESASDRLEAWSAGIDMFRSSPILGIGKGEFTENYVITAHNTFLLEAAELGIVGLILWSGVFYMSFKIVVSAIRRYRDREDAILAYSWARTLLACLCGITVGTMFLSLAYHPLIWMYLALTSAFYLASRQHDPEFRVVFGLRDLAFVSGFAVLWLVAVKTYLIARGI
jgi:O-antigen ligase